MNPIPSLCLAAALILLSACAGGSTDVEADTSSAESESITHGSRLGYFGSYEERQAARDYRQYGGATPEPDSSRSPFGGSSDGNEGGFGFGTSGDSRATPWGGPDGF